MDLRLEVKVQSTGHKQSTCLNIAQKLTTTNEIEMSQAGDAPFIVGKFEVHPKRLLLIEHANQNQQAVPPNLMNLLIYLAQNAEEVISRDQLIETVWQGRFVSEDSVNRSIAHLRKLLGDPAKQPEYIKTISKQGYQFLLAPQPMEFQAPPPAEQHIQPQPTTKAAAKPMWKWLSTAAAVVVVALTLVMLLRSQQPPSGTFARLHKQPLSTKHSVSRHPRFSNDGRFVVSEAQTEQLSAIVLRDLHHQDSHTLFQSDSAKFTLPTFSPSGNELVYLRSSKDGDGHKICHIEIYTFKTQQSRQLSRCNGLYASNLSWSKDGKTLFASRLKLENATAGLVSIDTNSGEMTELAYPEQANTGYLFSRLSPSNDKIVFVLYEGATEHSKIAIFDRHSKQVTEVAPEFVQVKQVVWGKSDEEIYLVDNAAEGTGIWYQKLDGSKPTFIYNERILDLDVDPVNLKFVGNINNGDLNIQQSQILPDGSLKHTELLWSTANEIFPAVSPKGRKLAYISDQGGTLNLWQYNLLTGQQQQLSQFKDGLLSIPNWSGDGRYISVVHNLSERSQLYLFDSETTQLVKKIAGVRAANWYADEHQLTLHYLDKPGVYLHSLKGDSQVQLFAEEIFALKTIKPGLHVAQKRKLGGLFKLALNNGQGVWTALPSGSHVGIWQLQGEYLSLTSTDATRPAPFFHIDPVKAQRIEDFSPFSLLLQRDDFSLDVASKQLFHVVSQQKSMALVLIKPVEK